VKSDKKISLFDGTCKCEQLFSRMKFINLKNSTLIDRFAFAKNLIVVMSSIALNIDILEEKTQPQVSH
jgi:hypothetical protein